MQCLGGSPGYCTSQHRPAPALHMLSFENFVKSMPPSLSELKVKPSFCFPIKIRDDRAVTTKYLIHSNKRSQIFNHNCIQLSIFTFTFFLHIFKNSFYLISKTSQKNRAYFKRKGPFPPPLKNTDVIKGWSQTYI